MPAKKLGSKSVWLDRDAAPEWTKEQFERAEIAVGGKALRPAQGTLTRRRGRPKKADAKVHIHIRLSPQVLGYFRAAGQGWQTRIDAVLQKWVSRRRKEREPRAVRERAA